MTKTVPITSRTIMCPKCRTKTMRHSLGEMAFTKQYFCDQCHNYFSMDELCDKYDYDIFDFWIGVVKSSPNKTPINELKTLIVSGDFISPNLPVYFQTITSWDNATVSIPDRVIWEDKKTRDEEYDLVTLSFLYSTGLPFCDDNCEVDNGFPY